MKIKSLLIIVASSLMFAGCSKSDTVTQPIVPNPTAPVLAGTTIVTAIATISATSGGNVSADGGANVTARGVCWKTSSNPTTANAKTNDATGTGVFTSNITGLAPNTLYYVRAYATNSVGTTYANEVSFRTTILISIPTVTTTFTVTGITPSSGVSGGSIISDGGATVAVRGVCWSVSPNPTTANAKTTDGTGVASFTSNITGLNESTVYFLRAYATNSVGTAYGPEISFTTPENVTVYFGGSNNKFYAINAFNGQLKWQYSGTAGFSYAGPCLANGKIYAGSIDNYLYCFDTASGNINWRFFAGNNGIESDPSVINGTVYFGSNDHYLYAIDANTGILQWRFLTGANVSSSPVVNNGIVFFGSSDSKIYALNNATGQLMWSYQTGAMINQSGPALANGILYVGSRDGYLYALNQNNGSLAWRYSVNNISLEHSSPTVVNNIVYIAGGHDVIMGTSAKGSIYAVNATTGQLVWEKFQNTGFDASPTIADGKLFITTELGVLLSLDANTGIQNWTKTILSNGASPAIKSGIVYVGGGGTGYFYAFDAASGIEKWRFNISGSLLVSGPCIVTSGSVNYSGESGMQQ
ncbi:MAG: PQQ-binding-like beta-propeller repeat protein [Ferruginibacter sp.]